MGKCCFFKVSFLLFAIVPPEINAHEIDLTFPDGFLIGAGSSARQHEGGWNASNENIMWDYVVHNKSEILPKNNNADVSSDFYHKYKEDIKLMKDIGLTHFRLSISWHRIFPSGLINDPSEIAIRFYHNVLDELKKQGIIAFVTIYHWDHPKVFEKFGGWQNESMAYAFADYAKFLYKEFGHKVKVFTTINEPYVYCDFIYRMDILGLGHNLKESGRYLCIHNMLKGHALAYHIYDKEFRNQQKGQVGIVISCQAHYAKDVNDEISADVAYEFECGGTLNPIYSETGDYPAIMKNRVAEKSISEGLTESKLPSFTEEWIKYIRGTSDYLGLNYYTATIVEPLPLSEQSTWPNDEGLIFSADPKWPSTLMRWIKIVPQGFRKLLRTVKEKYNNPPVYILENGVPDVNGINDTTRINYLYSHMKEMLIAIKKDKCNVKAYTVWSLLDGWEWFTAYQFPFGLISVDFNNEDRKRTPKKSAAWLKSIIKTRELQPPSLTSSSCTLQRSLFVHLYITIFLVCFINFLM